MTMASSWWTVRKGLSQLSGWTAISVLTGVIIYYTLHFDEHTVSGDTEWLWSFSFAFDDYAALLVVSLSAIALTLVGVEGQRHGDSGFRFGPGRHADDTPDSSDDWLADLYQTECPTTSPRRAELWAEINDRGVPAVVRSVAVAVSIPMLWFLMNLLDSEALWYIVTCVAVGAPLSATPTLGIVTKQGSAHMSTFDATRPLDTAWLVGAKISVATASMIAGVGVLAVSLWLSVPIVEGFIVGIEVGRQNIQHYFETAPFGELALWTVIRLVQLATMVAFLAATHTLYALYSDRLTFGVLGICVYTGVVPIVVAADGMPIAVAMAHIWPVIAIIVAGTLYFAQSMLKSGVLTSGQLSVLVLAWGLYALAYAYLLNEGGLFEADVPVEFIAFRAGICLLTLTFFAMAPWSLARARHR